MKEVLISAVILLSAPVVVLAAGLVPCGSGIFEAQCQFCHLAELGQSIYNFVMAAATTLGVIAIMWAGFQVMLGALGVQALARLRRVSWNVGTGLLIVFLGWIMLDTALKFFLPDGQIETLEAKFGPWNEIECVPQPRLSHPVANASRGTASGFGSTTISAADVAAIVNLSGSYDEALCAAAKAEGIESECVGMQALVRIESAGCRNKVSPVGARGCMQIMPNTARQHDKSLVGLTNAQIAAKLENDDAYNIKLGAKIYKNLYDSFGGDVEKVYAAYNGGPGALNDSKDCPGLARYQCVWNSPGCHGTGRTDCEPNTGYIETRNYVKKAAAVRAELEAK